MPVQTDGCPAQQAHQHVRVARAAEQASRFSFDIGKRGVVLDHGCHVLYHAGRPRVSR